MTVLADDPAAVVARQLEAYNQRNIDAFMATWAEDAEYFEHPGTLLARGSAEIRARHVVRFQEPQLYGQLLHRMAVGDTVVDHERVTRNFPEGIGHVDVIAIYQVFAGKIRRAWFRMGPRTLL